MWMLRLELLLVLVGLIESASEESLCAFPFAIAMLANKELVMLQNDAAKEKKIIMMFNLTFLLLQEAYLGSKPVSRIRR